MTYQPQTLDDRIVTLDETDKDRRESYRMNSMQESHEAKMKVGSKILKVEILDESAGGFMVSAKRIPKINPTQHVELFTPGGGAHLLRVAWRRHADGQVRLGLQRLCQSPPQQESPWLIWLVAAVVIGVGVGFVAATKGNQDILNPFHRPAAESSVAADTTAE